MSKVQREKGKRGEREVVLCLKALGVQAHRILNTEKDSAAERADIEIRGTDLVVDAKLRGTMPPGVFREAEARHPGRPLAVIWRTDGDTQWRVTMRLQDWAVLLPKGYGDGNED